MTKLTSAEACAGAGGLAIGLHRAGFDAVYAVDQAPDAVATLRQTVANADCIKLDPITVKAFATRVNNAAPELDLLAAGVPCQPFSSAGRRQGKYDPRDCFPLFLQMADLIRPRSFVIENVSSLLHEKHREYIETIVDDLEQLGYHVRYEILNAANYGVAQQRRRVFFVGFLDKSAFDAFRYPVPTHSEWSLASDKWVTHKYWHDHGLSIPHSQKFTHSDMQKAMLRTPNGSGKGFGLSFIIDADRPSGTIGTVYPLTPKAFGNHTLLTPIRSEMRALEEHASLDDPMRQLPRWRTVRDLFGDVRPLAGKHLTPPETQIIQDFPHDMHFFGKIASRQKQVGNAVPPTLGQVVGEAIKRVL